MVSSYIPEFVGMLSATQYYVRRQYAACRVAAKLAELEATASCVVRAVLHLMALPWLTYLPDVTELQSLIRIRGTGHLCCEPGIKLLFRLVSASSSSTAGPAVQVDEEADDLSFPAMISQLFEFVLCIVSNGVLLPLLQAVLPELAYLTIGALPPPPPPCLLPPWPGPQLQIHSGV